MLTAPRLAHLTPNWFAMVMGTGIIAVATSSLPVDLPDDAESRSRSGCWPRSSWRCW
ncbi:hypothetical protein P9209_11330 [Prescottella defluvii]|nr:hypothetical protein P9209_11330 [Prescottella defluvii]